MSDNFTPNLQKKINLLKARRIPVNLGSISFPSNLLLAPMSQICNAPFRLLMEELGAGGTVSELISSHGVIRNNKKTLEMLKIDPREKMVGIQLFGENAEVMAQAAKLAQESYPKFIDINMGCPVRKVVNKGGGSALLRNPRELGKYFGAIKKSIKLPLTVKMRTGWDENERNAKEILKIAYEEGLEFVAVHGRTRTQQYKGFADWDFLNEISDDSPLPIIGNGDLNCSQKIKEKIKTSKCQAFMLGRGPLRNPFIFLEPFSNSDETLFSPADWLEVIFRLKNLITEFNDSCFNIIDSQIRTQETIDRKNLIQLKKHLLWFVTGFNDSKEYKEKIFKIKEMNKLLEFTEIYFSSLPETLKTYDSNTVFMTSGHG